MLNKYQNPKSQRRLTYLDMVRTNPQGLTYLSRPGQSK